LLSTNEINGLAGRHLWEIGQWAAKLAFSHSLDPQPTSGLNKKTCTLVRLSLH
jgi:hypothetical protein